VNALSNHHFNLLLKVKYARKFGGGANTKIVKFDELGHHVSLLGCCHHFDDTEKHHQATNVRTLINDVI
jgi:hypothetical protein